MSLGAFGDKVFEVSQNRIYTFDDLGVDESLNVEMQETEGGKPATYVKGLNAMNISFSILLFAQYCNVQQEIDWWFKKMRSQIPEYLTLGNKTYGTAKMLLQSVSVGDYVIAANGLYLKAVLSLTFSEYTKRGYKKDDSSKSSTKKKKSKSSGGGSSEDIEGKLDLWQ